MSSLPALRLLFAAPDHRQDGDASQRRRPDDDAAEHALLSDDPAYLALRAGNVAAFEQLFRAHYTALRRFASVIVSADDASDVVDDVFAWLWASRERVIVRGSLATYLYSAVRHRALNAVRNQRKQFDLQQRFAREIAESTAHDVDSQARTDDDASLLHEVRAVIAQLPERRRLAITLRWDAGLGNGEIATILGIAPQSVANLIQRALADIRAAFPHEFA